MLTFGMLEKKKHEKFDFKLTISWNATPLAFVIPWWIGVVMLLFDGREEKLKTKFWYLAEILTKTGTRANFDFEMITFLYLKVLSKICL